MFGSQLNQTSVSVMGTKSSDTPIVETLVARERDRDRLGALLREPAGPLSSPGGSTSLSSSSSSVNIVFAKRCFLRAALWTNGEY